MITFLRLCEVIDSAKIGISQTYFEYQEGVIVKTVHRWLGIQHNLLDDLQKGFLLLMKKKFHFELGDGELVGFEHSKLKETSMVSFYVSVESYIAQC